MVLLCLSAQADSYRFAFEKEDLKIRVCNLDGSNVREITRGLHPDLSPDGTRVAFVTVGKDTPAGPERKLALAEVASGEVRLVPNVPAHNCIEPAWSPDGRLLAFYFNPGDGWDLAVIAPDGSGLRVLVEAERDHFYHSIGWAPDGCSLYCHTFTKLVQVDLNGSVLKTWNLSQIIPDGQLSSASTLNPSPDGRHLLVDAVFQREGDEAGEVWLLNLTTEQAHSVTRGGGARWIDATSFLYVDSDGAAPAIFRRNLEDGQATRVLPLAYGPGRVRLVHD
ncbi:MAG: TolB family protein [Vulcanimicrobiota bacterium]